MEAIPTIRLLVVEDDPGYLYLVRRAFNDPRQKAHWELTVARDGEEALRLLFEEVDESFPLPDLILLDWTLPKVTGYDVLRRVKKHRRLRRIPILVFSTSDDETISTGHMILTRTDI